MTMKVFAVYDLKACFYSIPFYQATPGSAIRSFSDMVNRVGDPVHDHPSDYVLFQLGEYDDRSGSFLCLDKPVHLGIGSDYYLAANSAERKVIDAVARPLATTEELNGGSK